MKALLLLFKPSFRHAAAAVFAAGILHLCIALASPHFTDSPAYRELTAGLAVHEFKVLPAVTPESQMLPFMGPEARYAACRFSATGGSVSVTANLPGPGWVLSIFTPAGENVYSAVAPPSRPLAISLRILPADDRAAEMSPETRSLAARDTAALTLVAEEGVLLIRAPDQGNAYRERNAAELARARCSYTARARSS